MQRRKRPSHEEVVADLRDFFSNAEHRVYRSGTPSFLSPNSIFHISQLEVLFEQEYEHDLTYRALRDLRGDLLDSRTIEESNVVLLWRRNLRYVTRKINAHLEMISRYSAERITKATGDYAETLTLLGLSQLGLTLVGRNTNSYLNNRWTRTGHNLDFIFEREGVGFGVEVKNTFEYINDYELQTKLEMCRTLGICPLFVVRFRKSTQWQLTQSYGGLLYIFKTKIFPPAQEELVRDIWEQTQLPVNVWNDWHGKFYDVVKDYVLGQTRQ